MKTRKLILITIVTFFILFSFIAAGNTFAQDEGSGSYVYGTTDTNDEMIIDDPMNTEEDMNMDNPMDTEEEDSGIYYEDPEDQGLDERNYNDESGYDENTEEDTEAPMDR